MSFSYLKILKFVFNLRVWLKVSPFSQIDSRTSLAANASKFIKKIMVQSETRPNQSKG